MKRALFLFTILSFFLSPCFSENIEIKTPAQSKTQKLIFLKGNQSFEIKGENQYQGSDQVLPKMLSEGWKIVSLQSSETQNGLTTGYVLLEKKSETWVDQIKKDSKTPPGVETKKKSRHRIEIASDSSMRLNAEKTNLHSIVDLLSDYRIQPKEELLIVAESNIKYPLIVNLLQKLKSAGYLNITLKNK